MKVRRVLIGVLGAILIAPGSALAATITVNTTADNAPNGSECNGVAGDCSLRQAIDKAASGDTVSVPANASHYAVTTGEIQITKPLTIQGAGASSTVIDASGDNRVFHGTSAVGTGTVTFSGVTITGGSTTVAPGGGAILMDSGNLVVTSATLTGNRVNVSMGTSDGGGGGAINNVADDNFTMVVNSSITNNTATVADTGGCCQGGGGLITNGVSIVGSHIDGNTVTVNGPSTDSSDQFGSAWCCSGGGGLYMSGGATSISSSTFNTNTVTVNSADSNQGGGGVYMHGGCGGTTCTMSSSTVQGNTLTVDGPTAQSSGDVKHCCAGGGGVQTNVGGTFSSDTINGNTANINEGDCCQGGGGLGDNSANALSISTSNLSSNTANMSTDACCNGGGAIQFDDYSTTALAVSGSLISNNTAHFTGTGNCCSGGGGVYESTHANDSYANSTIANNRSDAAAANQGAGGGIYVLPTGTVTDQLRNVTVADNQDTAGPGGGVGSDSGVHLQAENSIIARNTGTSDNNCGGTINSSLGYNLENSPDSCGFTATGDQVVPQGSLGLGALADNGGPTQTEALLSGSPAIDHGNPAGCADPFGHPLTVDQRGQPRPDHGETVCDIGAFEFQDSTGTGPPPTLTPPSDTSITKATVNKKKHKATFSFTASGTVTGFQCALVKPQKRKNRKKHKKAPKPHFANCSSPKTYKHLKHLKKGKYTFEVRAFNAAGVDPHPAIKRFKI